MKFQQNYVIGIAVSILLLVYVLLLLVCRGLDANDEKSPGIHLMVDPVEGVQVYYYLVTVYSGGLLKPLWAQTTSNISMQIYGCRGTSLVRDFCDEMLPVMMHKWQLYVSISLFYM